MQGKRKMSGEKSAHSFYPAPGIYHLRKSDSWFIFPCKRQIIVESEAFFEKQKKINEKSK